MRVTRCAATNRRPDSQLLRPRGTSSTPAHHVFSPGFGKHAPAPLLRLPRTSACSLVRIAVLPEKLCFARRLRRRDRLRAGQRRYRASLRPYGRDDADHLTTILVINGTFHHHYGGATPAAIAVYFCERESVGAVESGIELRISNTEIPISWWTATSRFSRTRGGVSPSDVERSRPAGVPSWFRCWRRMQTLRSHAVA